MKAARDRAGLPRDERRVLRRIGPAREVRAVRVRAVVPGRDMAGAALELSAQTSLAAGQREEVDRARDADPPAGVGRRPAGGRSLLALAARAPPAPPRVRRGAVSAGPPSSHACGAARPGRCGASDAMSLRMGTSKGCFGVARAGRGVAVRVESLNPVPHRAGGHGPARNERAPALAHALHLDAGPVAHPRALVLDDGARDLGARALGVHRQRGVHLLLGRRSVREVAGRRRLPRLAAPSRPGSSWLGCVEGGAHVGGVVVGAQSQARHERERVAERLLRRGLVAQRETASPRCRGEERPGSRPSSEWCRMPARPS